MTTNEILMILGMFAVTFSVRYVLFASADKVRFPEWLNIALNFVPPVVLTAIVVPALLMPQGEMWLAWDNPWLLAGLVSAVVAFIRKDVLTTIVVGMAVFMGLRFSLGL